jgi:hypothetical protein
MPLSVVFGDSRRFGCADIDPAETLSLERASRIHHAELNGLPAVGLYLRNLDHGAVGDCELRIHSDRNIVRLVTPVVLQSIQPDAPTVLETAFKSARPVPRIRPARISTRLQSLHDFFCASSLSEN